MTRSRYWICSSAILVLCFPTAVPAVGPYVVTNMGDLPGGSNSSRSFGINSLGQVVGFSGAATGDRALLWTPTTPNGTIGSLVDLGDLPGGINYSAADDINAMGQVTGDSNATTGLRAFLWTPNTPNDTSGSMFDLGELPGGVDYSAAFAVNSHGQVVGRSGAATGDRAFLWTPTTPNGPIGSMVDLGDLPNGLDQGEATAINSQGQVVGVGAAATGERGFLWTPNVHNGSTGSMIDLGELPGGTDFSLARAINSQGQVVGHSDTATGNRAFLWTPTVANGANGSMIDLGDLPGGTDFSEAVDINSLGQVVGLSTTATGDYAFLWTPATPNDTTGSMVDLHTLLEPLSGSGWTLTSAQSINGLGQIAGYGLFDADGPGGVAEVARGFLLTPIPEPSTFALTMLVPILLAGIAHRRAGLGLSRL